MSVRILACKWRPTDYALLRKPKAEVSGNLNLDPAFRDVSAGKYHLSSLDCGNAVNSVAIDAGDPSTTDAILDCDWGLGKPRADMGAYGGGN